MWRKQLNTGQPGSRGGQDIPIKDTPLVPTSSNWTLSPNSPFGYGLVSWVKSKSEFSADRTTDEARALSGLDQ